MEKEQSTNLHWSNYYHSSTRFLLLHHNCTVFTKNGRSKRATGRYQPGVLGACPKNQVAPPCIATADAHITGASMSPDNKVLWLTFHESCKNPAPAPARPILSCIRLIELDTNTNPIGAAKSSHNVRF